MTSSHSLTSGSRWFALAALFASTLAVTAITDEDPGKIEGTANPEALPSADPEKALLSTIKFPEEMVAKLFAREPDVQDPTAITFDEQNRLYIAPRLLAITTAGA